MGIEKIYKEGGLKVIVDSEKTKQTDQPHVVDYPNTDTVSIQFLESGTTYYGTIASITDKAGGLVAANQAEMEVYLGANFSLGGASSTNITQVLNRTSEVMQAPSQVGDLGILTIQTEIEKQPTNSEYVSYLAGIYTFNKSGIDARISFDAYISKDAGAQLSEIIGWAQVSLDGGLNWVLANNPVGAKSDNNRSGTTLLTVTVTDVVAGLKLRFRFGLPNDTNMGARLESRASTGLTELGGESVPSAAVIIQIPM